MPVLISYSSYDSSSMDIVSVIASFDCSGNVKPIYVRINGENFKIVSAIYKPSTTLQEYKCQIIDNDILKPVTLTYHPRNYIWTLPKLP